MSILVFSFFFFFNDTATTEIYTLSLHDALPISTEIIGKTDGVSLSMIVWVLAGRAEPPSAIRARTSLSACTMSVRSEEHTSELQSRLHLVCRLLLEKKKK